MPTLRRGAGPSGLGSGGVRASGVVPVGRDAPIGLDLSRFLSAPDPFGQVDADRRRRQPAMSAEETFEALRQPCAQMRQVPAAAHG